MSDLRLQLISGFRLTRGGRPSALPAGAERVLAFLAINRTRPYRSYVAGCLWPDTTEERARASLRAVVWKLGRLGCGVVEASRDHLSLAADVHVDYHSAIAIVDRVLEDPDGVSLGDCRCRAMHHDLLPGWYEDCFIQERERFRAIRLQALEIACRRLTRLGRYGEAVRAGLAVVQAEPLSESASRALIGAHLADGNLAAAMRRFHLFRACLRDEIGLEPSERMLTLVQSIGRCGLLDKTAAMAI